MFLFVQNLFHVERTRPHFFKVQVEVDFYNDWSFLMHLFYNLLAFFKTTPLPIYGRKILLLYCVKMSLFLCEFFLWNRKVKFGEISARDNEFSFDWYFFFPKCSDDKVGTQIRFFFQVVDSIQHFSCMSGVQCTMSPSTWFVSALRNTTTSKLVHANLQGAAILIWNRFNRCYVSLWLVYRSSWLWLVQRICVKRGQA